MREDLVAKSLTWLVVASVLGTPGTGAGPLWAQAPAASDLATSASVRDFGARGDGQADDTEAIQKAINSGSGLIDFPRGVYRITRTVQIELAQVGYVALQGHGVARVVMAGAGPAFLFRGTHFKSADPETFTPTVWNRERMPLVDGLGLVGDHPEAVGIAAIGTMQLTISRVHGRQLLHVVHLRENNRNVNISDCHFYQNRGCGVFYDDVNLHQSNITSCHISYNAGGGVVSRGGNVRNLHITGCDIESNMAPDQPATANVLIDSADSLYGTGEVAITGCTIQHNNPSPDSANIRILGRSQPSPKQAVVREGNVTITGNVLSDVQVNLHLVGCRGVTVTGNTLWQGYRHNILLEDCVAVVLGANNLDRNPRYDYGNTQDANNPVVLKDCVDCIVSGLLLTGVWRNEAGLTLDNCRRCNLQGCSILDCDGAGLLLRNSELCRISQCVLRDDRPEGAGIPLQVVGGRGNVIVDNVFDGEPRIAAGSAVVRDNEVVP